MKQWICTLLLFLPAMQITAQELTDKIAEAEKRHAALLRNYDLSSVSSNNFDVHYYRCEWSVDPAVKYISGTVTSHFTITSPTSSIVFDLAKEMTVGEVRYHGSAIAFTHSANNALHINFPSALSAGQKDSVSIYYYGIPPSGAFTASMHNGVPVIWTLSEPYGARTWWPCKDVLLDKADSIDIIITNPLPYISSSIGMPEEFIGSASRTTHWKHRYPIVAYLVAIAVTNYEVTTETVQMPGGLTMPLSMYAYPEHATLFTAATSVARFCLQEFPKYISDYPFVKERYAQTQYGTGGMEHQTNSFIANPGSGLVAHELAHQWFGDKVTCGSWSDLWLNEGFASYMEFIYVELTNPGARIIFLNSWANNITLSPSGSVYVADTLDVGRLFDGRLTYRKGGYLVHMLRWVLGDSVFFRGVRRYINDPALAYGTARTADLQRNLEAESGIQLEEFFTDWFYGEGYPDYQAQWSQPAGTRARVRLFQSPSHPSVSFFEMPVPLYFRNATRDTMITVQHTHSGQMFSVDPGFIADTMIIDPQRWILTKNKSTQKLPYVAPESLLIYPNPATTVLQIEFPAGLNGPARLDLYNSAGQLVQSATSPQPGLMTLSTLNLAAGIYWLRVSAAGQVLETRRVMVGRY